MENTNSHPNSAARAFQFWTTCSGYSGSVIVEAIPQLSMFELPTDFQWLTPWAPISEAARTGIEQELRREISRDHVLANCKIMVIGESDNYDDFLFATDSPAIPLAAVHLTWSVESDPRWPSTGVYKSLDEWIANMAIEHEEFEQRYYDN